MINSAVVQTTNFEHDEQPQLPAPANAAALMEAAARQYRVAEFRDGGEFKVMVQEAWGLLRDWFGKAGFNEEKARPVADLAYATMSAFAGMKPEDARTLAVSDSQFRNEVFACESRERKNAVIASKPDLVAFYAERDRRTADAEKVAQQQTQQRQAQFDAGAPAPLLATLRSQGVKISLAGPAIVAPAGNAISEADHAAVREHKHGLVELLKQEEAATRPVVLA